MASKARERENTNKNNSNSRSFNHHRNRLQVVHSSMASFFRRPKFRVKLSLSLRNNRKANSRRAKEVVEVVEAVAESINKSNKRSKSLRNKRLNSDPSNPWQVVHTPVRRQVLRARFRRLMVRSSASRRIWPA